MFSPVNGSVRPEPAEAVDALDVGVLVAPELVGLLEDSEEPEPCEEDEAELLLEGDDVPEPWEEDEEPEPCELDELGGVFPASGSVYC
ncbi:MAG TPA: hypothetical protein VMU90_03350 [Solirubrobacteraceae bacterium]|nr:hypothetical protein [Solirubrobacteraceae bacterium]